MKKFTSKRCKKVTGLLPLTKILRMVHQRKKKEILLRRKVFLKEYPFKLLRRKKRKKTKKAMNELNIIPIINEAIDIYIYMCV